MKKLAILSPLVILMASTSLAQDSCIVRPSCADMGYTKTEADCTGKTTLKCPFDLTKVSCEDEDSSSGSEWDWANSISCSELNYTKITLNETTLYKMPFGTKGCFIHLVGDRYSSVINFYVLDTEDNILPSSNVANLLWGPTTICVDDKTTIAVENISTMSAKDSCIFVPYKKQISTDTEIEIPPTEQCNVGDIYYDDDTCSSTFDATKNAIGIVFDTTRRYIVSLTESLLNGDWWSGSSLPTDLTIPQIAYTSTDLIKDFNGKTYTEELSSLTTYRYIAAARCADSTIGNKSWFLPSGGQMYILGQQAETINTTIKNMNFNAYTTLDYSRTWTSDSYDYNPSLDCNIMLTDKQTILYWTSNRSTNSSQSAIAYSFNPNNGGFSQIKHNSPGYVGEPSNCGGDSGMVTVSSKYYATRCIAEY